MREVTGDGQRQIGITLVVNNPGVHQEKRLAFAPHGSVVVQRPYMVCDGVSEENIFKVQGLLPNERDKGGY